MRRLASLAAGALLMMSGCLAALAQTVYPYPEASAAAAANQASVPSLAGRVSLVDGALQIWRIDENNQGYWDAAQVNDVVAPGGYFSTGVDSRAELRFGPHALRMDSQTQLAVDSLDIGRTQLRLQGGSISVRLHGNGSSGDVITVLSGARSVDLRAPGRYRLDGEEDSPLRITTFEGSATVRAAGNVVAVNAGRSLDIATSGTDLSFDPLVSTDFDDWALRRDFRPRYSPSTQYVSSYMTGYEDLDGYGDWVTDVTYGLVWVPRVVIVDWAPYRYGRWRWVAPWGWTWVDDAPWGYAPFHYGRWVYAGARWCWWPGAYAARPIWAPALVGWVGQPGWSASISVGGPPAYVGWYPLAPWNAYQPRYITNVNYNNQLNRNVWRTPPGGVAVNVNVQLGGTAIPGGGFRDPIRRVGTPLARIAQVRDLQPVAPPATMPRGNNNNAAVVGPGTRPGGRPLQPGEQVLRPAPPAAPAPRPALDRDTAQPRRDARPPVVQPAPQAAPAQPPRPAFDRDTTQPRRDYRPPVLPQQQQQFPLRPVPEVRVAPPPRQQPQVERVERAERVAPQPQYQAPARVIEHPVPQPQYEPQYQSPARVQERPQPQPAPHQQQQQQQTAPRQHEGHQQQASPNWRAER